MSHGAFLAQYTQTYNVSKGMESLTRKQNHLTFLQMLPKTSLDPANTPTACSAIWGHLAAKLVASTQIHGVWGRAGSCGLWGWGFVVVVVAELARGLSVLTGIHTCPDMHIVCHKCLQFRPSVW